MHFQCIPVPRFYRFSVNPNELNLNQMNHSDTIPLAANPRLLPNRPQHSSTFQHPHRVVSTHIPNTKQSRSTGIHLRSTKSNGIHRDPAGWRQSLARVVTPQVARSTYPATERLKNLENPLFCRRRVVRCA